MDRGAIDNSNCYYHFYLNCYDIGLQMNGSSVRTCRWVPETGVKRTTGMNFSIINPFVKLAEKIRSSLLTAAASNSRYLLGTVLKLSIELSILNKITQKVICRT
jgi:hypothetical protein